MNDDKPVYVCEDESELAKAIESELLGRYSVVLSETGAEAMVAAGAAVMLQEHELDQPGSLLAALTGLLLDPIRLAAMSAAARTQAHPAAAERIANRLAALAGNKLA